MAKRSTKFKFVAGTGVSAIVLGANEHRIGIVFGNVTASNSTIRFGEAVPATGDGYCLRSTTPPATLWVEDFGDAIKGPIHMLVTAASDAFIGEIVES